MCKGLGTAGALGQQHGERDEGQQPAYGDGGELVAGPGVTAGGEGEEGCPPCAPCAAARASATACDAGMMPRITT